MQSIVQSMHVNPFTEKRLVWIGDFVADMWFNPSRTSSDQPTNQPIS